MPSSANEAGSSAVTPSGSRGFFARSYGRRWVNSPGPRCSEPDNSLRCCYAPSSPTDSAHEAVRQGLDSESKAAHSRSVYCSRESHLMSIRRPAVDYTQNIGCPEWGSNT